MKRCICIQNYDVYEDFGMNFTKSEIYNYEINANTSYISYNVFSSKYYPLPFNKKGFDLYFIDINKIRKNKLEKIENVHIIKK